MPRKKVSGKKADASDSYALEDYSGFEEFQENAFEDAPFWRRLVAYLLDAVFFYFSFFQIFMMIYLPKVGLGIENFSEMESYILGTPSAYAHLIAGFAAASFVFLFYFMLFEKNFKTTIGKKIMGLRLSSEKEISYKDVFIRNLTKSAMLPLLPIDLIGLFFYKKRFTEMLTSIKVIYSKPLILIKRMIP